MDTGSSGIDSCYSRGVTLNSGTVFSSSSSFFILTSSHFFVSYSFISGTRFGVLLSCTTSWDGGGIALLTEKVLGFLFGVLFCMVSASLRTEGVKLRKDLGGPNIDSMSSVTLIIGIYLTVPRSIVYPSWLPQLIAFKWSLIDCTLCLRLKSSLIGAIGRPAIRLDDLFECWSYWPTYKTFL